MGRKQGLVFGVGINDANYVVQPTVNGVRTACPYYRAWKGILARCFYKRLHEIQPTYLDCTVDTEWLTFSVFKAWMETQDWKGKHLDKDILFANNKRYSKETCVFVSKSVNMFLTSRDNDRGKYLIGVDLRKNGMFRASCSDGYGNQLHIGLFVSELEAHLAWRQYKHALACKLADEQTNMKVAEALRKRFAEGITL